MAETPPIKLLRIRQVVERVGLHRGSIYRLMAAGEFPRPVPLSAKSRAWVEAEIDQWLRERIALRDGAADPAMP